MSNYFSQLQSAVIQKSISSDWEEAVKEWDIRDCTVDSTCSSECVCGKKGIKYKFTISNRYTHAQINSIGSKCINKFNRDDLDADVSVYTSLGDLYEKITNNDYIKLSEDFSRKTLLELYRRGAFLPNKWNNYSPQKDYNFLVDMYNLKRPMTEKQSNKVNGLIAYSIKPFIRELLHQ